MDRQRQCGSDSRNARSVTFRGSVHVKFIRYQRASCGPDCTSLSHVSCGLWYTNKELKSMARRHAILSHSFDEISQKENDSFLGLETKSFRLKRRHRIESAKYAVLMEQAAHWDDLEGSVTSDDSIPTVYEKFSRESQRQALERGRQLALALLLEDTKSVHCADDDAPRDGENDNDAGRGTLMRFTCPTKIDGLYRNPQSRKSIPNAIQGHVSTIGVVPFTFRPAK
jgi:hypothetical protein